MSVQSDIEDYFKDVVFTVEANSFEQHALWTMYHYKDVGFGQVPWEEGFMGHGITIGYFKKMPVVISLNYARINGRLVAFFYGCSQVVDHRMVDAWVDERTAHLRSPDGRPSTCDSMNFGHCIAAIRDMNSAKAKKFTVTRQ